MGENAEGYVNWLMHADSGIMSILGWDRAGLLNGFGTKNIKKKTRNTASIPENRRIIHNCQFLASKKSLFFEPNPSMRAT